MYADLTTKNKSLLKRFSHGSRFNIALDLLNPKSEDRILDYGTGDGFMLTKIRTTNSNCRVVGYEPMPNMFKELSDIIQKNAQIKTVELVNNTTGLNNSFNKICCLEVFEHLTEENQQLEITVMKKLLTDDGQLIISVPIEVGFSSLLKNIARIFLRQTHGNTTFKSIMYSLFGVHFDRGEESYISSHMGFYYQDLEKLLLKSDLTLLKKVYSPIPTLRGVVNSQVFFILEKASE